MRKSKEKDLTKASKIVSMPEVRKFKLDLSGKQQQEVDVDFDVQFDDVCAGNEAAAGIDNEAPKTADATRNLIPVDVQQRKQNSERRENRREESTQSSLGRQQRTRRKSTRSQSGSRTAEGALQQKQRKEPIGGNEVSFFHSHYHFGEQTYFEVLSTHSPNASQMLQSKCQCSWGGGGGRWMVQSRDVNFIEQNAKSLARKDRDTWMTDPTQTEATN
ncbi:unnamed protein product [Litomosoides sigmodontis]|uniref:Uncharacterized protein n=1 Tax=Litomosoides sigmodontis TaxID=42156 RepID=A0A3P6SJG0_LITSI|nr:unnamed protein product [Litomosoides sigmodontis]